MSYIHFPHIFLCKCLFTGIINGRIPQRLRQPEAQFPPTDAGKSFWTTVCCGRYPISLRFSPSPVMISPSIGSRSFSSVFISVLYPSRFPLLCKVIAATDSEIKILCLQQYPHNRALNFTYIAHSFQFSASFKTLDYHALWKDMLLRRKYRPYLWIVWS